MLNHPVGGQNEFVRASEEELSDGHLFLLLEELECLEEEPAGGVGGRGYDLSGGVLSTSEHVRKYVNIYNSN